MVKKDWKFRFFFVFKEDCKCESSEKMITGTIETMEFSGPISIEAKKYFYKKIGNCFTFFGDRKGDPLLILGPNWIKLLLNFFFFFMIFLMGKYI